MNCRRSVIYLQFYTATSEGTGAAGGLYYGYGVEGDTIFCREGFKVATKPRLREYVFKNTISGC